VRRTLVARASAERTNGAMVATGEDSVIEAVWGVASAVLMSCSH
jgi:hypothetical protein